MADGNPRADDLLPNRQPVSIDTVVDVLSRGRMEVKQLLPWSSNYTFLATVTRNDLEIDAVYKPCRGERPLWDFPEGTLANREVAAYVVSQGLGWPIVPPTVLRDGPHGAGMVQFYIDADPNEHYFTFGSQFPDEFKKIAVFDALVNNADRKAGHCLRDRADHVWAIDHGICFHTEPKLRTVIWEFAGQPIPPEVLRDVRALRERLASRKDSMTKALSQLLAPDEMDALRARADRLLAQGRFPNPGRERHVPWPPV